MMVFAFLCVALLVVDVVRAAGPASAPVNAPTLEALDEVLREAQLVRLRWLYIFSFSSTLV